MLVAILIVLAALVARVDADDDVPTPCDEIDELDADEIVDTALAPEAELGEDVVTWAHGAGEDELREARQRRHHSPIGRVDLSLAWRRVNVDAHAAHEVWLLGTWRL
jgi:hypothetical protein